MFRRWGEATGRALLPTGLIVLIALSLAPAAVAQPADLDCDDFGSQAEAQAALREDPSDPYGLDGPAGPVGTGQPGVACEGALPGPVDFTPVANEGLVPGSGVTWVTATADQYTQAAPPAPTRVALPDTGGLAGLVPLAGALLVGSGLLVRRIIR